MKKNIFSLLIALVLSINISSASNNADAILKEVISRIEAYEAYRVDLQISMGDYSLLGYYEVDNQDYYLIIDKQEMYGDATSRYEIYNERKEVVIDSAQSDSSGNMLANPAMVFSSILNDYTAHLLSDDSESILLTLKPKGATDDSIESITLHISKKSMQPTMLEYNMQGEIVMIAISNIAPLSSTIKRYSASQYSDYEIIDFR